MAESNALIKEAVPLITPARIGWAILILATLYVCYFTHLGAIGFVGPDEPRYAWIARAMAETGDWVTPRLYGRPWFEKPPLLYWSAAFSFQWFGVSEAAARLPSALSALLATLALAWLALRLYGAETARWLLLLLPTTVGMIGFSHAAATDMPFSAMLTIAMVCAAVVIGLTRDANSPVIPQTPWLALILFGFFLGLAVLAKGPAGTILAGGAVFLWAVFTRRWRDALRLVHPAAVASFCLTALPWYILCARRNPDFLRVFLIEHNFKRYLTPEFQHVQPFWYYIPVLLVAFLPWTALLLWSSVQGAIHLWRTRCAKESTWFLFCWAGFCVAFFSLSQSKLPGYVLPAVMVTALMIAPLIPDSRQVPRRPLAIMLLGTSLSFGLVAAMMSRSLIHISARLEGLRPIAAVILYILCLSALLLGLSFVSYRSNVSQALLLASGLVVLLSLVGNVGTFLRQSNLGCLSADWLASDLVREGVPIERLRVLNVSRSYHYTLNFYLHKELQDWKAEPIDDGFVLSDGVYCDQLQVKTQGSCVDLWGMRDFECGTWALLRISSEHSMQGLADAGRKPH